MKKYYSNHTYSLWQLLNDLEGLKVRNGPQEGPGTERRFGGSLECKLGEDGQIWDLQKGELPKLLCLVFFSWEDRHPRAREAYSNRTMQNVQSILTETYKCVNSKRGPTASWWFWTGSLLFSGTKSHLEQAVDGEGRREANQTPGQNFHMKAIRPGN